MGVLGLRAIYIGECARQAGERLGEAVAGAVVDDGEAATGLLCGEHAGGERPILDAALDEVVDELDGNHLDVASGAERGVEAHRDRMAREPVRLGEPLDAIEEGVVACRSAGVPQAVDRLPSPRSRRRCWRLCRQDQPGKDLRHVAAASKRASGTGRRASGG